MTSITTTTAVKEDNQEYSTTRDNLESKLDEIKKRKKTDSRRKIEVKKNRQNCFSLKLTRLKGRKESRLTRVRVITETHVLLATATDVTVRERKREERDREKSISDC